MSEWLQALRVKKDLIWSFQPETIRLQSDSGISAEKRPEAQVYMRDAFEAMQRLLRTQGQPYWVGADMATLASHAAASMPDEPLRVTDLPDKVGVAALASPIAGMESFAWMYADDMQAPMLVCLPMGFFRAKTDMSVQLFWNFGVTPNGLIESEAAALSSRDCARTIKAIWTLSQQSLASVTTERSRVATKMARREGAPDLGVRVVRLRRRAPSNNSGEARPVDWTHRWVVSGHWRNQWLPSVKHHRLQWIAPYTKGPEDKPLVVRETIKAWVR